MPQFGTQGKSTLSAVVTQPAIEMLSWAAAFIEGEGWISLRSGGSVQIGARQVDKEPIERLLALFGGNAILEVTNKKQYNNSPSWKWYAYSARAVGIMLTLYPWFTTRRKEQVGKVITNRKKKYG